MKITCLTENTQGHPLCCFEHGLSLFIETENHTVLADAGQSDIFIKNAETLGKNLRTVDTVFLSHGHYDHSGGLDYFTEINSTATIYAQSTALQPFYHGERYIGVSEKLKSLDRLIILNGNHRIDGEFFIFSGITGRKFFPKGNLELERELNGKRMQDNFCHEQCLVISENSRNVLVSGCAHNGILNILDRYNEIFGTDPDAVISGFHLMKNTEYTDEDIETIKGTAEALKKKSTVFYSGHCTGQAAFEIMKNIMGEKLKAVHSGQMILEYE